MWALKVVLIDSPAARKLYIRRWARPYSLPPSLSLSIWLHFLPFTTTGVLARR